MTLTRWNPWVSIAPVSELLPRFSALRAGNIRLFESLFGRGTLADIGPEVHEHGG